MATRDNGQVDAWVAALIARHTANLSRSEFLKSVRALSVRYVERRNEIGRRSPTDSAGKRAAFAAFFAPLHFLTVREIARSLPTLSRPADEILDLGCGTGVTAAALALEHPRQPALAGIDRESWVIDEARWNWRFLGVTGRASRGDLVTAAARDSRTGGHRIVTLGWSVNELNESQRLELLARLRHRATQGETILVVEPIAGGVAPWWKEWVNALSELGATANQWKFDVPLPPALADLDEAAGFQREGLTARSLHVSAGR